MGNIVNFIKRNKLVVGLVTVLALVVIVVLTSGTNVIDPSKANHSDDPRAGKDYALLYNHGKLYGVIDSSSSVLRSIQNDLALFARTTRPEFKNPESLIGFTFDKKFKTEGSKNSFTGHYYSVDDSITVDVYKLRKGIIRLSITNRKDSTNIDEQLSLNGPKNRLLAQLPIDKDYYSIRYFNSQDKVIVTFYEGYTRQDLDTAVELLKKEYGDKFQATDFTFSLNGKGIFSLQEVTDNLTHPIGT